MPVTPTPVSTPAAPVFRYFIMGLTSMPAGTAFTVATSQQHLLTQFALGMLGLDDVVDCLGEVAHPQPLADRA